MEWPKEIPWYPSPTCGKHLGDLEACTETTVRYTCGQRHAKGSTDKIEFHQDIRGHISWRPIPMTEKKQYDDDGSRIAMITGDDVP
jgi:hypothetical protein